LIAHELGHILSDHMLYRTALNILLSVGSPLGIFLGIPFRAVRAVLLEWYRAAELSCDRAAALVTRDPLAVCRTLMVIAAGTEAQNLDLDVFMRQGQDYREKASPFDRLSRLLIDLDLTHPMSVQRVHELMEWVRSGEYDRIVAGEYPRRGEPASPRAEAGDAVAHYAERFKETFSDLGDSVGEAGQQIADWLRRARGED
jgi:hypothetical protein